MIRRKIKRNRVEYNILVAIIKSDVLSLPDLLVLFRINGH